MAAPHPDIDFTGAVQVTRPSPPTPPPSLERVELVPWLIVVATVGVAVACWRRHRQ